MYRITRSNTIFTMRLYVGSTPPDPVLRCVLNKQFRIHRSVSNICYILGLWIHEIPTYQLISFLETHQDIPIGKSLRIEDFPDATNHQAIGRYSLRNHIKRTKSPVPLRFIFHIAHHIEPQEVDDFILSPITDNDRYIVSYIRCSIGEESEVRLITSEEYLVKPIHIDLNAAIGIWNYLCSSPKYVDIVKELL